MNNYSYYHFHLCCFFCCYFKFDHFIAMVFFQSNYFKNASKYYSSLLFIDIKFSNTKPFLSTWIERKNGNGSMAYDFYFVFEIFQATNYHRHNVFFFLLGDLAKCVWVLYHVCHITWAKTQNIISASLVEWKFHLIFLP